jgi:diguanylate cyclase (GGDEF)-like protein/PAS domain S-box-containing protein
MLPDERYRIIVETASEGIWMIDESDLTTFVNPALVAMLGYRPKEMLGRSVFDFIDPAHAQEARRNLRARREGISERLEFPFHASDGHKVWALLAASSLHGEGGKYTGALAMVTDITAERARAGEGSHLAAIVRSSVDSIIGMDTVGVIESWNEASSRLYGYGAEEALGQRGPRLLARDPAESERLVARAAGGDDQREVQLQDLASDGRVIDVSVTLSPIRDARGLVVGVSRFARDIGWRKRLEGELRYVGEHDWLTDLLNRRQLIVELDRCLAYAARYRRAGAVLTLDIDHFDFVNDSEGHDAGDRVLKSVAEILTSLTGDTDLTARLGGDEFAVVLPAASEQDALALAAEVRTQLGEQASGPIKLSVGVSVFTPGQKLTADDALVAADVAQYEAREHGGDRACVFRGRSPETLTWFQRIRWALAEDRLLLYGQPIVDLRTGLIAYRELLIRMLSADGEIIAPGEFLPPAERFGLITEIDLWVLEHALRLAGTGERVTINLGGPSIGDAKVLSAISHAVGDGLDPGNVIFEITETAALSSFARAEDFARALKGLGCELALDDFGTGFGSFRDLKHLDARYLKIDTEFVRDLLTNDTDQKVVRAIVDIAHSLQKKAVAEGVGDAATLSALRAGGVDFAQGFHLGAPQPVSRAAQGVAGV